MARTRSEEYDDKRQLILDQAAALFARNGFPRTSLAMLSQACNASKAWIYHYYQSKEAILFDILDQQIRQLIAVVEETIARHKEPKAQLRALLHALMDLYLVSRDKHIVLLNDLNSLPEEQQAHIIELEDRMVHMIGDLIAQVNPSATRRTHGGRTPIAMALLGMINWTDQWFKADGPMSREEYADLIADLFLNGILSLETAEALPTGGAHARRLG